MNFLTHEEKTLLDNLKCEYEGSAIQVFESEEAAARSLISKGVLKEDVSPNNICMMVTIPYLDEEELIVLTRSEYEELLSRS